MNIVDTSIQAVLTAFRQGQRSQEDALRAIVSYPAWRVSVDKAEQPEIVLTDDGIPYLIAESSVDKGQLFDGRSLIRNMVPQFGGIAFDPDESWGIVIKPEHLPEMQCWAQIVDLEDALLNPAPSQVNILQKGHWWGAVMPDSRHLAVYRDIHREGVLERYLNAVTLFTAPDAIKTFRTTDRYRNLAVVELGPELWQDLASRTDYDGIRVNPLTPRYALLPPHLPAALMAGRDVRTGAEPLPARTVAEIHLWLDLMGARPQKRSHTIRQTSKGLVVIYEAWWGYEKRQIPFTPVDLTPDPLDLGEGPSQILCAGLLLRFARGQLAGLPRFRWQANSDQRQRAARALPVLHELEKLVEGDAIPFTALRTPEGANFWHLKPEAFTAVAVAVMLRRAKALAK